MTKARSLANSVNPNSVPGSRLEDGTVAGLKISSTDPLTSNQMVFLRQETNAVARTVENKLGDVLSVKDFGAMGDGVSDDTGHIQAAFDSLTSESSIFFPPGTYIVSPTSVAGYILNAPKVNNITIYGTESSIIKVKDNSGNYRGIIGWTPEGAGLTGLTVHDITFDHNSQNNVFLASNDYAAQVRSTVSTYGLTNDWDSICISRVRILNCDSIVSFYFPRGLYNGGHVLIDDCRWINARNGNGQDFDQSFINATCESLQVVNCRFKGQSWALSPRTAIETHCSNCIVSNNVVEFFQIGANLTGISQAGTTYRQICQGNTFNVSRDGILIWSQELAPALTTIGFESMIVSDNIISLKPYDFSFAPAASGFRGIYLFGGANHVSFKNLLIANNIIEYPVDVVGNSILELSTGKNWGALGGFNLNASAVQENVKIVNNTVVNCPSSAIFFDVGTYRGLEIQNNSLIDDAVNTSTAGQFSNNVPIYLAISLASDAKIANNTISNSQLTPSITDFMYLRDRVSPAVYSYLLLSNTFSYAPGATLTTLTDYVGFFAGVKAFIEGFIPSESVRLPLLENGVQSSLKIQDTGALAIKSGSSGTNWTKYIYTNAPPSTGAYRAGDIAYNTAPSAGSTPGWVCVLSGTPGVWKAMAGLAA